MANDQKSMSAVLAAVELVLLVLTWLGSMPRGTKSCLFWRGLTWRKEGLGSSRLTFPAHLVASHGEISTSSGAELGL